MAGALVSFASRNQTTPGVFDPQTCVCVCRCVGECGLDGSEGFPTLEAQQPWFDAQVRRGIGG